MSYLTPYFPRETKAFLEAHPALAELLGGIGLVALGYLAVGLLILWRVKFYRPKPLRPKEPKPKSAFSELGLISKFLFSVSCILNILFGLAFIVIVVFALGGIAHSIFTGQGWQELAFVFGLFLFSVFCLWLIGR